MSEMTNTKYSGEKISFSQLINEHSITIPIIQRDYAQGRNNQAEVRKSFLSALHRALKNDSSINLDFIYGNIENQSLIPLDGQQRLTTLFLLHWYLAVKEEKYKEFCELLVDDNEQIKFRYETRSSSKEFCDGLINIGIDYQNLLAGNDTQSTSLSETIKDSRWYYLSWQNDPTVRSMLTMLDAIHQLFQNETDEFYERLLDDQDPLITFQFLKLDDFKLTDDIYIKMNARGKLLTPFETFKAWLQKQIQKTPINITVDKWQSKLDIEWTDIFWKYRNEKESEIDSEYYNYFILMTLYFYIANEKVEVEKNRISDDNQREIIIELLNDDKIKHPTFEKALNETGLNKTFRLLSYFEDDESRNKIETVLSKLGQSTNVLNMIFGNGENNKNLTLWDKTFLYSFVSFILGKKKSVSEYSQKDIEQLFNWTRVCKNLIYNTTIDRPGDFVNTVKQINKLSKQSNDIYKYLDSKTNKITGFSRDQLIEERIKASLIINDKTNNWIDAFIFYENHEYYYGQIGFLLELSKRNGKYDIDEFRKIASKTSALFKHDLHNNDEFIVERALLSEGNYLIERRGNNRSFCKYELGTLRLREENWRRVFRDENKLVILQSLLDKIEFDKEKQSLKKLINNFSDKDDWRYYFIKNSELIKYCKDRNIRYQDKYKRYILLSRSQLNGYHVEYYSYAFYKKYIEDNVADYAPFSNVIYNKTCGDEDPRIVFSSDKHSIVVSAVYKNGYYTLTISSNENGVINKDIKDILNKLKYKKNEDIFVKSIKTHRDAYLRQRIFELCDKLKVL